MTTDAVLTVTGTAATREREAPPVGVLTVKVVSNDGEVLAAAAFVSDPDGPTPFELSLDAALAPDPDALRLWVMLRTDAGVWGTPELVSARDEVNLSRVDEG